MDLNAVLLFLQVVDAGSLTEAARRTGIPKSTISRKLTALEADLGVRLLQRSSRRFGLTDPGRQLVERGRRIATELDEVRRDIRAHAETPQGTLRVAASVSLAEFFLAPIVIEYLGAVPGVDVQLELSPIEVDLIARQIDVAIRVGEPDARSAQIARRLGYASLYLCASPDYLERNGVPESVVDLSEHDVIFFRREREAAVWTVEAPDGSVERVSPHARFTVDSHPVARMAAIAGVGIAYLPAPFCRDELEEGTLIRLLPGYRSPLKWVYATFPSRDAMPAAVRSFVDFVATRLETAGFLLEEASPTHVESSVPLVEQSVS